MTSPVPPPDRVRVEGKFFRLGAEKFYVKGVTYGPFAPNADGEMFPARAQTRRDLAQLRQLGANVLRVYYVPPRWLLDLLHEQGLKVLVDIPWAKHLCFMESDAAQAEARRTVRAAVVAGKDHPAVFAFSVVNEISAEIVRWSGVARVQQFVHELIAEGRGVDARCLFTFTSFPPTEFLQVDNVDFTCFNVYLHDPKPFTGYLARLQTLADAQPLVLGEFGMDSIREGEARQSEFLAWQIELAFRAGLAGTVIFSYTDDWWRGGMQITDWGFGLTTRDRQPKAAFQAVQRQYQAAPYFPLPAPRAPKVSVVVATYNGSRTLQGCLESLARLNYPDYEVIVVDDGSTDRTPEFVKQWVTGGGLKSEVESRKSEVESLKSEGRSQGAEGGGPKSEVSGRKPDAAGPSSAPRLQTSDFRLQTLDLRPSSSDLRPPPSDFRLQTLDFRYIRQPNQGLSAARNAGIRAATGAIVAFTDDDCRADEDWLYYLVHDLLRGDFAGIGGPNFLPPEDSRVAAAVMASPGGPAHVLLTDTEAEHIPGCNMAFYKWALEQIGLFDPVFRKAGDDVDICWRLQDGQFKIGFSPAAFVWHHRRATVRAYLRQQAGYGEAEALLIAQHPEHYNTLGGGLWRGRIYASAVGGLLLRGPAIYHGIFGSAFFQRLYAPNPVSPFLLCTALGYHLFVNLPLLGLALNFAPFRPLALVSLTLSLGTCAVAALQANVPPPKRRFWSRPLIALLFLLQPIVRGWARFKWRAAIKAGAPLAAAPLPRAAELPETFTFWCDGSLDRLQFLHGILARLEATSWLVRTDTGWTDHDFEVVPSTWIRLRFTAATEELDSGKRHFRCRLTSRWSLLAGIAFGLLAAGVAGVISQFARDVPWVWFALVLLPLLNWFFASEAADAKAHLARFLDEPGGAHKLVRLGD